MNGYDLHCEALTTSQMPPVDRRGGRRRQRNGYASDDGLSAPRPSMREAQSPLARPGPPRATVGGMHPGRRGFPGERDARAALAVLSQFADGRLVTSLQRAIADTYGTEMPASAEPPDEEEPDEEEPTDRDISEAPLSARQRNRLARSSFALPEQRAYPIDTEDRARSALARVAQFGSNREQALVRAAVRRRYPNISVTGPS